MKKREKLVLSLIFIAFLSVLLISSISFISAANETGWDKGYSCLKTQIDAADITSLTPETLGFSLLSLSYDSAEQTKLKAELDLRKDATNCWPSGACTLKETSLALLAYNSINQNTDAIESWLLNQTKAPTDLVWYLEIETANKSTCKITYDNSSRDVIVNEDKTITGSYGSCLSYANNGWWLQVATSCYGKEIKISCDTDFFTTLIYKKSSESTIRVSDNTHSQGPGGTTTEKVESYCFSQLGSCNYEGSLWVAAALQKSSNSITPYLTYLMALSSENSRYLPAAFLYSLTGFNEYLNELSNSQNTEGYWQTAESTKRYYDTATALYGLSVNADSEQAAKAKEYLLDLTVQAEDGCWNGDNIRDTAFILYASAPKVAKAVTTPTNTTLTSRSSCESFTGYSCTSLTECENLNGTDISKNFYCLTSSSICCSEKKQEESCSSKGGTICSTSEDCKDGTKVSAQGTTSCCLGGTCILKETTVTDTCSIEGSSYSCRSECAVDEDEENSLTCPNNNICCKKQATAPAPNYWWVWLLVILVILLALAIVFRNQLKIWLFRIKNKFSKTPISVQQQRPLMQSMPPGMRPPMRPMPPGMRPLPPGMRPPMGRPMPGQPQRPGYPRDKELDETLRKLREMGK